MTALSQSSPWVFGNTITHTIQIGKLQPRMWRCPAPAKELKVLGLDLSPFSKAESFICLSTMADAIWERELSVLLKMLLSCRRSLIIQALPKVEQFLPLSAGAVSTKLLCGFVDL